MRKFIHPQQYHLTQIAHLKQFSTTLHFTIKYDTLAVRLKMKLVVKHGQNLES